MAEPVTFDFDRDLDTPRAVPTPSENHLPLVQQLTLRRGSYSRHTACPTAEPSSPRPSPCPLDSSLQDSSLDSLQHQHGDLALLSPPTPDQRAESVLFRLIKERGERKGGCCPVIDGLYPISLNDEDNPTSSCYVCHTSFPSPQLKREVQDGPRRLNIEGALATVSAFNLHTAVFFSLQSLCFVHTGKSTGAAVSRFSYSSLRVRSATTAIVGSS